MQQQLVSENLNNVQAKPVLSMQETFVSGNKSNGPGGIIKLSERVAFSVLCIISRLFLPVLHLEA